MDEMIERLCVQARELRREGRMQEALSLFQSAYSLASDPVTQAPPAHGIGYCLWKMGQKEEARKIVEEAMEKLPEEHLERLDLEFLYGWWYWEEKEFEKAKRVLDRLLPRSRKYSDLPDGRELYRDILVWRGIMLTHFQRPREAIPILEEALTFELRPEEKGEALYNLGVCHYDLEQRGLAREKLQAALQVGLWEDLAAWAHYYLGLIHFQNHAYGWAKQEFEFCEIHAPEGVLPRKGVLEMLSHSCRRLGLDEEANRYENLARQNSH